MKPSRLILATFTSVTLILAHPSSTQEVRFCELAKLAAADGEAGHQFGLSVALDGDTAVVGASRDDDAGPASGSAYIFERNAGGPESWGQAAKLGAADGAAHEKFGWAVAISGDTAVVGAVQDDDLGFKSGSAYIFERDGGGPDTWGQVAKLTAADGAPGDQFGYSVSIRGDTAVVGAKGDHDLGELSGSAYVFERDAGGPGAWGQVAKLTTSDGAAGDQFGYAVAVDGSVAVVGAPLDDDLGIDSGSAYVFERDAVGSGAWAQVTKLTAADGAGADVFGVSVALSGDTAVVGAPFDNDLGRDSGSAYLFERDAVVPGAWGQVAKVTAADGAEGDLFGISAAISGDRVVVGGAGDNDRGNDSGAAYIFEPEAPSPGTWVQVAELTPADGTAGDQFGYAVSISGDGVVGGAPFDSVHMGSAYIFGAVPQPIFEDGFESGDTSAWHTTVP